MPNTTTPAPSLPELFAWRVACKKAEDEAIATRREADRMIADALPVKEEGSVTSKEGGYKTTITYGISRKVDTDALQEHWAALPAAAQAAFKFKAEVSTAAYRALTGEALEAAAFFVTSKPSSPSVTVELVA